MKTTWTGCTLAFLLLSGCGGAPPEDTATDSGTGGDTDATAGTTGGTPSGVSDSDSVTPTDTGGSVSNSQTDTGETTAPTSTPTSMTDSTSMTASDTDTTGPDDTTSPDDTTGQVDPSLGESSTGVGTLGDDTGTTTSDDTTSGDATSSDDTTTSDDTTSGGETGEPVQCGVQLKVTIRDFMFSHPDFEDYCCGQPNGMVQNMLGPNNKPVFANAMGLLSTPDNFNQWYTDVNGVNQKTQIVIDLQEIMPGVFSYSNNAFFPIDNMLWGNEGQPHNYHFTTEIHAQFQYFGGESFTFSGDDDVWVFINKQLAIDIGGVHGPIQKSVNLDTLGLTLGQNYPLDVFHAERHTVDSNFRIDTTICSMPM